MNKIILFELNEVPFRVIDWFCRTHPRSALARIMPSLHQYESYSEDVSSLSPWKTWPTVHRGVIDGKHLLHDFGQDLTEVDKAYPPLWKILTQNGVRSGVFGSLHTYPLPEPLENYTFYFPDTFAAGSECFPDLLSTFQAFNLEMARESARNVSRRVPWKSAMKVIARSPHLGLKVGTYGKVGRHLVSEWSDGWKKTRRRTYQVVLAFDIFMKQLRSTKPAFVTFFTNHVASSMHRYWAACFPEDYDEFEFPDDWVDTYSKEIDFVMEEFDGMFEALVEFVDRNPGYVLWISSSMGQEATVAKPLETQLYIEDRDKFMSRLGVEKSHWEARPSMLPRYVCFVSEAKADVFRENLGSLLVDGAPVEWAEAEKGFFMLKLGHENLYEKPQSMRMGGREIPFESMGLENTPIEDKSNATAYHIPSGVLLIYDPDSAKPLRKGSSRPQVSTLEIAPTILKNYAVPAPGYMKAPVPIG